MPARVKFRMILAESARLYFAKGGILPKILLIAAVATAAMIMATMTMLQGFSVVGDTLDPKIFQATLSGKQWAVGATGVVSIMITLALCFAASVHAAAGARSVGDAFGRIRSGPMQIFWLQCVIYALAMKFSPVAGAVLFLLIAFVVPVALREDLGPNGAADRAWSLSAGYRVPILLLEVGALLVSVVLMTVIGTLFLQANSPFVFIAPLFRAAISWIFMAFLIAPFQFLLVALTRLYQTLTTESEPVLHARAASNV